MSFFKNLFKSYPDYDQLISSINLIRADEASIISNKDEGFGKEFRPFAKTLPEQISIGVDPILRTIKEEITLLKNNFVTLSALPEDLEILKKERATIEKEIEKNRDAQEVAKRAKSDLAKAQEILDKTPPDSPEYSKHSKTLQSAREIDQQICQNASSSLIKYESDLKEYKIGFISTFTTSLAAAANERKNLALKMIDISKEILENAEKINFYEDPMISKLQIHLDSLDLQVVE